MNTSWETSSSWYDQIVGKEGHYYHKRLILPHLKRRMQLKKGARVLDLGCGQGILAKTLPAEIEYVGIDLSPSLIKKAKEGAKKNQRFIKADATKPLPLDEKFSHCVAILSLQNMAEPFKALKNLSHHLKEGAEVHLILNHPAFRIPRQSSWGEDPQKKLQYRRVDSYMTPQKIPIVTHPGKGKSIQTLSYHWSLSRWFQGIHEASLVVTNLYELCSDKQSSGRKAKQENRARKEFPLFLCLQLASKQSPGS